MGTLAELGIGIHDSVPMDQYVADPCLEPSFRSSSAHLICTRSPLHAWNDHPRLNPNWKDERATRMEIGSACHALLLEADDSKFVVIDAPDYRTRAAQEKRDEATKAGLIPLLQKHYGEVSQIIDAARRQIHDCPDAAYAMATGRSEQTLVWKENETWCSARPDWISGDGDVIVNYKTTAASAEPDSFGTGCLVRGGYHVQAYHHLRGFEMVTGHVAKYLWIVQEIEPPYAVSFLGMSESLLWLAKKQWTHALERWRECLASGVWPGYPSRVCWIEGQPWQLERWASRPDVQSIGETLDAMRETGGFLK